MSGINCIKSKKSVKQGSNSQKPVRIPACKLHKASGQARVIIEGRHYYLGKYGSEQADRAYRELITSYLAPSEIVAAGAVPALTVAQLCAAYLADVEGRLSESSYRNSVQAVRPLLAVAGELLVGELSRKYLIAARDWEIKQAQERGRVIARSTLNLKLSNIKTVIKWGVEREIVPDSVLSSLAVVRPITAGQVGTRETLEVFPVSREIVELTCEYLTEPYRTVVRLLWCTGLRCGEVCQIRTCDLDRSGEVWRYVPRHHKTEGKIGSKVCLLGPRAQEILGPLLSVIEPERLLLRRKCGLPIESKHVGHAIERVLAAHTEIPRWHQHQIRHSYASRVADVCGEHAAQTLLGHTSVAMTRRYIAASQEIACKAVLTVDGLD